ncbi:hypothetical protein COOONC_27314 [Cooperia oncophora]
MDISIEFQYQLTARNPKVLFRRLFPPSRSWHNLEVLVFHRWIRLASLLHRHPFLIRANSLFPQVCQHRTTSRFPHHFLRLFLAFMVHNPRRLPLLRPHMVMEMGTLMMITAMDIVMLIMTMGTITHTAPLQHQHSLHNLRRCTNLLP